MEEVDLVQLRQDLANAKSGGQQIRYLLQAVDILLDEVFKSKEEIKTPQGEKQDYSVTEMC